MDSRCVLGCVNYRHTYGIRNEATREIWRKRLGVEKLFKTDRLCDKHFADEMFVNELKKRLKTYAVPKIMNLEMDIDSSAGIKQEIDTMVEAQEVDVDFSAEIKQEDESIIETEEDFNYNADINLKDIGPSDVHQLVCETVDIAVQTYEYLRNGTPKKTCLRQKLAKVKANLLKTKDICRKKQKTINFQKSRILFLEGELKKLQESNSRKNEEILWHSNYTGDIKTIDPNIRQNNRFSNELKLMSLSIYFISPVTYRLLRPTLNLPAISSLRAYIDTWTITPGNIDFGIKALELKTNHLSSIYKYCSISADEMSLKAHVDYCRKSDSVIGLEDLGCDEYRSSWPAIRVLVFMAQGIAKRWKHPIAYYFVRNCCTPSFLKKILFEVVRALCRSNLIPVQFVCDQGPNFRGLARILDVDAAKPFFFVDESRIHFFFDAPHLLKSTRNCLLKHDIVFDGTSRASWEDILFLYNKDCKLGIRIAPKLTEVHLRPNTLQRKKVKYASQVFSNTVSAGCFTYVNFGLGPRTMVHTGELLEFFNNLFDIFNSCSRICTAQYRKGFSQKEIQMQFLQKAIQRLHTIQVLNHQGLYVTNQFNFLKGWLLNISSLISLWQFLSPCQFQLILTRHLNKDCLEQFFGEARSAVEHHGSLTALQFTSTFQKLWRLQYLKVVRTGNCESIETVRLHALSNHALVNETSWLTEKISHRPKYTLTENLTSNIDVTDLREENSFIYVCGWLFQKCCDSHSCSLPMPKLVEAPSSSSLKFSNFKQFAECNLAAAPAGFVDYIRKLNELFSKHFQDHYHIRGVANRLFELLQTEKSYKCCENLPKHFILHYFIRIRIYFVIQFWNRDLCTPNFKNKLLRVSHL